MATLTLSRPTPAPSPSTAAPPPPELLNTAPAAAPNITQAESDRQRGIAKRVAKRAAYVRKVLRSQANRPGQAPVDEPYWIVMDMSRHQDLEAAVQDMPRAFFRHPSEALAIASAQSLAAEHVGRRFGVFAAGPTFKIEKQTEAE